MRPKLQGHNARPPAQPGRTSTTRSDHHAHATLAADDLQSAKQDADSETQQHPQATACAPLSSSLLAAGADVHLQTATADIVADGKAMPERILLDSGSQRTYMSRELAQTLHLPAIRQEELSVSTFAHTKAFDLPTYTVEFDLLVKDGSTIPFEANIIPCITGSIKMGLPFCSKPTSSHTSLVQFEGRLFIPMMLPS